jgi:hypothetical protein
MVNGRRTCQFLVFSGLLLAALPAGAQTLVEQMSNTFLNFVVLAKTPDNRNIAAHTPVFVNDPNVVGVTTLMNQVSNQLGAQVSTFPLGSSSGGFTYSFEPSTGTFARSTDTFGPAFAERAATLGKGKVSFGMNYVHASYKSLDGLDLQNGDVKFELLHQELTPPSYVSGDVIQAALDLKLSNDTAAFAVNYGATNKLDLGIAIPLVRVAMDLTFNAKILDLATHISSPSTHVFANGQKSQAFSATGSASGVGDIVLLAKYNLMQQQGNGLAVGVDITLPTGDADNMLGTGATLTKVALIGSRGGRLSPHVNLGFTAASGGTGISNQVNYIGGVEYAVNPKTTLVGDFVGRTLTDSTRFNAISFPHAYRDGSDTAPLQVAQLPTIAADSGSLSTALGAVGVKFNPTGSLLISAHVLLPMNNAGLKSRPAPVVGFEYAF